MRSALWAVLRTFKNIPDVFVGLTFCSCKASIHHIHVNKGRFRSQALLDDQALAACLAYVDLNPIRAGMATTPESSDHISVQHRIQNTERNESRDNSLGSPVLYPFKGNPREPMPEGLPFHVKDYLELVDWIGRIIRKDKRGATSPALPPILERLDIEPKQWLFLATKFESRFKSLVGCTQA